MLDGTAALAEAREQLHALKRAEARQFFAELEQEENMKAGGRAKEGSNKTQRTGGATRPKKSSGGASGRSSSASQACGAQALTPEEQDYYNQFPFKATNLGDQDDLSVPPFDYEVLKAGDTKFAQPQQ